MAPENQAPNGRETFSKFPRGFSGAMKQPQKQTRVHNRFWKKQLAFQSHRQLSTTLPAPTFNPHSQQSPGRGLILYPEQAWGPLSLPTRHVRVRWSSAAWRLPLESTWRGQDQRGRNAPRPAKQSSPPPGRPGRLLEPWLRPSGSPRKTFRGTHVLRQGSDSCQAGRWPTGGCRRTSSLGLHEEDRFTWFSLLESSRTSNVSVRA